MSACSARGRSSDPHAAIAPFRDAIDHWSRVGDRTHQWTTLRNLADLLRRLGDDEPADLLDAASDRAPDAPARGARPRPATVEVPGRAAVLEVARRAIERNLTRARPPRPAAG